MSRVDTSAREACEAAALPSLADLVAAASAPLPALTGTQVTECIGKGEGAAIVHDAGGVYVVDQYDPEAHTPTVLADYAELFSQVDAGAKPSTVAKLIVIRERKALLALRQAVGRGRQAVAA